MEHHHHHHPHPTADAVPVSNRLALRATLHSLSGAITTDIFTVRDESCHSLTIYFICEVLYALNR